MNDAVWETLMNFEEFWGKKMLNVLVAIHTVLYSVDDEKDTNQTSGDAKAV
jgi:hypothetical protein